MRVDPGGTFLLLLGDDPAHELVGVGGSQDAFTDFVDVCAACLTSRGFEDVLDGVQRAFTRKAVVGAQNP